MDSSSMNRKEKFVLFKNAAANVVRGGAAAMVAIVLPPFLTRLMTAQSFGAWSLVLQLSAYIGYLDFGIQTAVGRFVAHANEKGDTEYRDRIVSTSIAALSAAAILGIGGSFGAAALLPQIFRQMPAALVGDARIALLLVAGSLAVGLPASVFNGIFVGIQRNEVPAAIIGGSRICSAALLVLVVRSGGSLIRMAIAVAAVNLASYGLQYLMYRRLVPGAHPSAHQVSGIAGRELFDYCLSLSIWSVAMLLISGLDVTLVGYFQFEAVAYYAVATSLVMFLAGLQNALFNVMIPSTAVLHARGQSQELGRVMVTATRYGTFLLLLGGVPLILVARTVLSLWVGPGYAVHGARFLQVLVAANMIRLSAVPYVMTLIGAGEHRLVTVTPLLEGVSNLLASVVAGYMFGALGVAIGTLFGSLVGVGGNFLYNMRRTAGVAFRISDYLRDGLLRPAICTLPLVIYVVVIHLSDSSDAVVRYSFLVATLVATGFVIWRWGLVGAERERLRSWRLAPQA
jgi:O-antigen/teichoic acid export membrane protein